MFNVGGPEVLVILLLALIVLGPQRLPDAAKQVGKFMGEVRRMSSGFQQELRAAMDDPTESAARQRGAGVRPAKPAGPALAPVPEAAAPPAERAAAKPAAAKKARATTAKRATAKKATAKKATATGAPRKRAAPLRAAPQPDGPSAS